MVVAPSTVAAAMAFVPLIVLASTALIASDKVLSAALYAASIAPLIVST
jgi:hypothetical protein